MSSSASFFLGVAVTVGMLILPSVVFGSAPWEVPRQVAGWVAGPSTGQATGSRVPQVLKELQQPAAPSRPIQGHLPGGPTPVPTREPVPLILPPVPTPTRAAPAPVTRQPVASAPFCAPGQLPRFRLGLAELKRQLGPAMGEPVECEHVDPASGDTLQQTTTGLAFYHRGTRLPTFTDGWRHWALTPGGLVAWEGHSSEPPPEALAPRGSRARPSPSPTTPAPTPTPAPVAAGERVRVVNTDGEGVVLRASPRLDDRRPAGFLEGAELTVLERAGTDWARVRGDSGLEGWVPAQYLAPVG